MVDTAQTAPKRPINPIAFHEPPAARAEGGAAGYHWPPAAAPAIGAAARPAYVSGSSAERDGRERTAAGGGIAESAEIFTIAAQTRAPTPVREGEAGAWPRR